NCWTGISAAPPRNWRRRWIIWRRQAASNGTAVGPPRSNRWSQESERRNWNSRWEKPCLERGWTRSKKSWIGSWPGSEGDLRSGTGSPLFPRREDPLHAHLHNQIRIQDPFILDLSERPDGVLPDVPVPQLFDEWLDRRGADHGERLDSRLPYLPIAIPKRPRERLDTPLVAHLPQRDDRLAAHRPIRIFQEIDLDFYLILDPLFFQNHVFRRLGGRLVHRRRGIGEPVGRRRDGVRHVVGQLITRGRGFRQGAFCGLLRLVAHAFVSVVRVNFIRSDSIAAEGGVYTSAGASVLAFGGLASGASAAAFLASGLASALVSALV